MSSRNVLLLIATHLLLCIQTAIFAGREKRMERDMMQLHEGRLWPCQEAGRSQALNRRFGTSFQPTQEDSLPLSEIRTVDDTEAFRRKAHPMCRYCNNDGLAVSTWVRSTCVPDEWIAS